jgi:vacuolar-type H+-ATPase subunit I/STV1
MAAVRMKSAAQFGQTTLQSNDSLRDLGSTGGKLPHISTKDKAKGDGAQNAQLQNLTNQVENMAGVFGEANKARVEHRKMMEERHQDVVRRIASVKAYCDQESQRLDRQVHSFHDKFEHDLERLTNDMLQKLDTKVTTINAQIDEQEQRVKLLEDGLEQEKKDRIEQTRQILGEIKKKVEGLAANLATETKIRQCKEQEMSKRLVEYMDEIHAVIEKEKDRREQICKTFRELADREHAKLAKRQVAIARRTREALTQLEGSIHFETATREEAQNSVVDNVSSFIQRFQENIREEGEHGN